MRTDGLVREVVRDAAIGVGVADTPEGLSALHRPGCAAAIWRRQPLPGSSRGSTGSIRTSCRGHG